MSRNPFEFGRELDPDELVDREPDVDAAVEAMLGAGKLFVIGPRRYGKTSILRAASDRARGRGVVVLRYDAEAFPTIELLAARLLADAAAALTGTIEKAGTAIRKLFASVRPVATFDAGEGTWSVTLGGAEGRDAGAPLLADVLDGVERAARKANRTVAVVIDEFQKVVEDGGAAAEGQIRAAIQRHRRVGYVFAGSATRLLADMTGDPKRPFYKLGETRFLGPVPRSDFAAFIERGFTAAAIPVRPGAIDAILDLAEEVPYNVQLLAHACWQACRATVDGTTTRRGKPRALTPDLVRETRNVVALRSDPIYTQIWTSLSASQRKALLALLRERGHGLASTEVSRRYGVPVPTMQKALKALEAKGIIREEQVRGAVKLRAEDPLFSAWIELVVPR
jgi:DNA-binding transcriptional ArsR family regulator